ncbi:hypothetical protein CXF61_06880 [Psychrobacter sp. 4Dc]|uniref:hypothetical protein n=1 Tax=Psychrobacter sp. 4Dc TaxID=888437 RepID=UPI000CC27690|nr:hypothetical protein [Psychrobacter sp. 4Dc]PKH65342.1 hypothetical protein CXF61_06880 [Psychrobacter sp. 4Dc]
MTLVTSLRIDTAIKPASYLRALLYVSLTGVMMILAWFASLALWQYLLIFIVSAAVASYLIISRPILLHISQPSLSQRVDKEWQLLIRTGRGDELWQAELIDINRYQWAVSIELNIVEPYQRTFSTTIFRDQVNSDQWRQLNILTNTSKGNAR